MKEKHRRILAAVIAVFLFLIAAGQVRKWYILRGMTEEEREIYYEVKQEEKDGYRRLSSHQLDEMEETLKSLYQALKSGDTRASCDVMGVPDTFDAETYSRWLTDTGFESLLSLAEDEVGILYREEQVQVKQGFNTQTYIEDAYYLFDTDDQSRNVRLVFEEGYFTPDGGLVGDYTLLAPSARLYEYSTDLSSEDAADLSAYITCSVDEPYQTSENWVSVWYQYDFPRFLNTEPHFQIHSDIGNFDSSYLELTEGVHTVLADIQEEDVEAYVQTAEDLLKHIFSLLQAGASDAEIGEYLLSSELLSICSPSGSNWETVSSGIESVEELELYLNTDAEGVLPASYNCRLTEEDGVVLKVNALLRTTEGECRLTTTLYIRCMDGEWKLIAMDRSQDNSLFENISIYDPQW